MKSYSEKIETLVSAIKEADSILIGAGAGLSTAAGFQYSGKRFTEHFKDFEQKYGFHDMYTGGFYPYPSLEEYWAYWSRYILLNRYQEPTIPVYPLLYSLVKERDYFVLTTNVDHCFQKAGFDKNRLFYTQGDYGLFQCSYPCCEETFDNENVIKEMVERQKERKIPTSLIPHCPHCGRPLSMNLRCDDSFVEDDGWKRAKRRLETFLLARRGRKILYLELGVGFNTPGIIKYPFWRLTMENTNAIYAAINLEEGDAPLAIRKQSILIGADIYQVLKDCCVLLGKEQMPEGIK